MPKIPSLVQMLRFLGRATLALWSLRAVKIALAVMLLYFAASQVGSVVKTVQRIQTTEYLCNDISVWVDTNTNTIHISYNRDFFEGYQLIATLLVNGEEQTFFYWKLGDQENAVFNTIQNVQFVKANLTKEGPVEDNDISCNLEVYPANKTVPTPSA